MADDENIFDPSLKKKKKLKKPLDLSVLEGNDETQVMNDSVKDTETFADDAFGDDFSLKKKKKKKKTFNLDAMDSALPDVTEKDTVKDTENGKAQSPDDATGDGDADIGDDGMDFDFSKKKKKKKKIQFDESANNDHTDDTDVRTLNEDGERENDAEFSQSANQNVSGSTSASSWLGSDRDYTYDELLQHVFNIIKEKNPDIDAGTKKRLVMRPPQVLRVGTKKTSFANFLEICRSLHRQPKHTQAFLLAELGTSGSVDANNQLIIKGRFQQKQIENVLRRYIKEYVACQTCRSPDTIMQKETRLFFLQCETCGSRRSVASIKSGFQAVTGKRAAIRAKTA